MHILVVHQNFPAQFGHVARQMVKHRGWKCTFVPKTPSALASKPKHSHTIHENAQTSQERSAPVRPQNTPSCQIDIITTKKVKKKTVRTLKPLAKFRVSYLAASGAVEITVGSMQTFPTGGQITVLGGLTTATGGTLSGPAVFTISKGGKSIGPS